jgi:hypothetical protein
MSIRRMMLFTLGAKIKNLIDAFKTRVLATQGEFEAESCLEAQLTELDNDNLLDSASLIVTPNGYKENLLYSVVPNNTTGDMSVTRATTATRVNADGFIEQVPYNLFQRSEEFENVFWTKQRTSITQNTIMAPNGTMTADNLIATIGVIYTYTGALGVNVISSSFTQRSLCTVSFYLKYNGLNRIRVMYGTASTMGGDNYVEVDLQLGIITGSNLVTNPFIENVGNGWYRVGFTDNITSATNNRFGVGLGDTVKTIANGIDGVYIWGAQLVDGSLAKDYFLTTNGFNVPRIDYSNGSCPSILVEPQRTNVLIRSEELNITPWSSAGINVTPNTIISPSGLLNADTITGDGNLTLHQTFQTNISYVSGSTYTFSVYVKKGTNDFIQISLPNNTFFSLRFANFDINTGVIGNVSAGVTASILNAGNGWYRCIVTSTASATITSTISLVLITSSTSIRNENNSLNTSVNVWGAQLEVGTNVTSYIPTFASTVTRNADVISKTGISSLIGQTEGTMFADVKVSANKESVRALQISDGTIGNRIQLAFNGNNFAPAVVNGGVVQAVFPTPFTAGRNKLAIAYANNDVVAYLNGIQIGSDSLATIPLCNLIDVGHSLGGSFFNNEINFISLFKTRLTNTQLATLTTL